MASLLAVAGLLAAAAPVGHGGPIRSVAAGAGHVVSAGFDGAAIVWPDAQVLRGHDGAVNAVALMADGRVVTGGADGVVLVWREGRVIRRLEGHAAPVSALAVQGERIASAAWDGTVRLWAADGAARVLEGHAGQVNAVGFAPDGAVVSGGYDGTLRLWADDGSVLIRHLGPAVNALAVAGDGEIAAACGDGLLRLVQGETIRTLAIDTTPLTGVAVSGEGGRIAVASLGGSAMVVDRRALQVVTVFLGTEHPLWSVAYDGDSVLTGGAGRVVRRWDAATGRPIGSYGAPAPDDPLPAADRGAQVFRACAACHTLGAEGTARSGPSLHGVLGRRAGSLPGFAYSEALRASDLVWTRQTIADLFDRGPHAVLPGTRMPEQRVTEAADREALVQFLERATR